MENLAITCGIAGILFSLLAIMIRLSRRDFRQDPGEWSLSIALFGFMWFIFIYLMVITGYIVHIPWAYNKGIPIYYLCAPGLYIYLYTKISRRPNLPRYWWMHAVPCLIGLIDLLPYARLSNLEQIEFLQKVVEDLSLTVTHDFGFIPQQWHYYVKLSLAMVYMVVQWRLLLVADVTGKIRRPLQRLNLYGVTILFSVFHLLQMAYVLNIAFNSIQADFMLRDYNRLYPLSIVYLILAIWLCIAPFIFQPTVPPDSRKSVGGHKRL